MKNLRKRSRDNGGSAIEGVVDNPFESRGIFRKKHDVFNRKAKGEKRNVAKARGQAAQRREKTLLVDYERSRKANTFRDRRFGEDDANLLLEEKMWARMQQERSRRSRGSGTTFNLCDEPPEALTHEGQALPDEHEHHRQADEEEDDLNAEIVSQLHFGGGTGHDRLYQGEKTRQELLNDIIAKSKERKLEKAKGKEEQESERERLDEGINELLGMLNQKPSKGNGVPRQGQSDDYDVMMRELVHEARAQPTDRLQTSEEAAKAEKARLDTLEKNRIKRMSNQLFDGNTVVAGAHGTPRIRKGYNDDEVQSEDEVTAEFTGEKHGEREEGESEASDNDPCDIDSNCSNELLNTWASIGARQGSHREQTSDLEAEMEEGKGQLLEMARDVDNAKRQTLHQEIPYVLECPSSYEDLLALLAKHATSTDDINMILDRIHKYHSIKLDCRNKERMHNFYDVLLKRFRRVGNQTGNLSSAERNDQKEQLDFLSGLIYDITSEMPEVAASLWHRFLGALHRRMIKAMADLSMGANAPGCWPRVGTLLALKLMVHLFPCTDFRHPVVTPVLLHLSQCLSQCPVRTIADLTAGVFSCGLVLHCSTGAGRLAPEAIVFLSSALALFCPFKISPAVVSPAFGRSSMAWLRAAAVSHDGEDLPYFQFGTRQVANLADRQVFATGLMTTILKLLLQVANELHDNVAYIEIFSPIQRVLAQIDPEAEPPLPKPLAALQTELADTIGATARKCLSSRKPLCWRVEDPPALDALAPKFQENYKMKKDGHKDTELTKFKQLQRQVKRERRGAMRELKRDAMFLENAKAKRVEENETDRRRRLRDNLTWLEEQQATINQQVKLGGKLMKGGGSSSAKRVRVGRGP